MAVVATLDVVLAAKTDRFSSGITKAQSTLNQFSTVARQFAAGFTVATVLHEAVRASRDFESAMAKSTSIMGNLSNEMRSKMRDAAFDVAKSTSFAASQAAESFYFLASAGMTAEQSLAAAPKVASFAQAGMFDLAQATELLVGSQMALGLSSADAQQNLNSLARVSDVLTKASVLSNASVEQFAQALTNKAAGAMRLLGIEVEEGTAALGVLADHNIKGEKAGTALATVYRELTRAAIENKAAHLENKIAVFDSNHEFRKTSDIIADLERMLSGLSDEMKLVKLAQIGLKGEAAAFVQNLIGTSEKIAQYESNLRVAQGTTKEISDNTLPEFEKGLQNLTAEFQKLSAEGLGPALKDLGGMANSLSKISGAATGAGLGISKLNESFGMLGPKSLGGWARSFNNFLKPIADMASSETSTLMDARRTFLDSIGVNVDKLDKMLGVDTRTISAPPKIEPSPTIKPKADEIAAQMQALDAEEKAKEIEKLKKSLRGTADAITEGLLNPFEMTAKKVEELQKLLELKLITPEIFQRGVAAAQEQLNEAMADSPEARARAELLSRGEELQRSLRKPGEIFGDSISDLQKLLGRGAIDISTFQRGLLDAGEALLSSRKDIAEPPNVGALQRGTQEAFAAAFDNNKEDARHKADMQQRQRMIAYLRGIDQNTRQKLGIAPI